MHELSIADELADIRAEIASLKRREAALRAAILDCNGAIAPGRWARVDVAERRSRVFDKSLLPPRILDDPRYWRERVTRYVQCFPVQGKGPRPAGTPSVTRRAPMPPTVTAATGLDQRPHPTLNT